MKHSLKKGQALLITIISLSVTAAIVTALATYIVSEVGKHTKESNIIKEKIALKNESYEDFGKFLDVSDKSVLRQGNDAKDVKYENSTFSLLEDGEQVSASQIRLSFEKEKSDSEAIVYSYRITGKFYSLNSFVKVTGTDVLYDGYSLVRID